VRRLLWLLVLLPGIASPATDSSKQHELDALRSRIATLRNEVEQASADRSEAADGLRTSEQKISDVNRALRDLQEKAEKLRQSLSNLGRESAATLARLHDQEQQLAVLLRQRYSQDGDDATRLLLSGQNPGSIQRDLEYYAYIGRARAQLINEHKATLEQLAALEADTRNRKSDLDQVRKNQLTQRQVLDQEKQSHQSTYNKLSEQILTQRKQIDTLVRDQNRLTRLIERLQRLAEEARTRKTVKPSEPRQGKRVNDIADASLAGLNFPALKGKLALPVAGELLAQFGQARAGGGPNWKGLFIKAKAGQPVHAVASGKVVFADWLRGFGNLLIVDHGSGYLSLYSNNESLYKQAGDRVKAGDVIAAVGNTGGQEESGLYFELRRQGQPFDPMSWVR
jgi:septal ring factor EnvC (AmiA/AmiB activator)